jgi:DNA-binding NtrC family response regulator
MHILSRFRAKREADGPIAGAAPPTPAWRGYPRSQGREADASGSTRAGDSVKADAQSPQALCMKRHTISSFASAIAGMRIRSLYSARTMERNILVVDDEERLLASLVELLEGWGYCCRAAGNGADALDAFSRGGCDAALVDLRMPGIDGLELLRRMRAASPELPILMMTGYPSVESAVTAMKFGAADFLTKPLDLARLKEGLGRMTARGPGRPLQAPSPSSGRRLDGDSPALRELRAAIERVAPTDASVIVFGESGTGKELVAETLHALSRRSRAPLLKLNCAAIPEGLLESELFGHERGSFTGAEARKAGLLEKASGGTLFLDEIGEMDLKLQAKLLRVLQDGEYRRVGGSDQLRANVRVVSATNRDLGARIAQGAFREDLFYRLSVIQIRTPPLRERIEDLPVLARLFAADFARRYGKETPALDDATLAILMGQPWPGNARELRNCMERAIIFCDGPSIGAEHLPGQYRDPLPSAAGAAPSREGREGYDSARESLDRGLVLDALARAGGNRTKAAELLGIHRRTLYNKLERLGIDPDGPARG